MKKLINKAIVGALLLTVLTGTATPIYASSISDKYNVAINNQQILEEQAPALEAVSFPDVKSTDWFYNDVMTLANRGAIGGYSDGTFGPKNTITRGEFLKIAILTVDKTVQTPVVMEHWASGVLNAAYTLGVVKENEIPMTSAALNKPITRYEMARIMMRINEGMQKEGKVQITGIDNIMSDYSAVPQEFRAYVEQAYMKGMLGGVDANGTFAGNKTGTRGEAAAIVNRLISKGSRAKVDVNKPSASLTNPDGKMTESHSKDYIQKAMKTAKFYSQNGKYYMSVDLIALPKGFRWQPIINSSDSDGKYLFSSGNSETVGLKGKQVFELEGVTQKDIKNGASARFALTVKADGQSRGTAIYQIDTGMGGKINENIATAADTRWVAFDTTGMFDGWK